MASKKLVGGFMVLPFQGEDEVSTHPTLQESMNRVLEVGERAARFIGHDHGIEVFCDVGRGNTSVLISSRFLDDDGVVKTGELLAAVDPWLEEEVAVVAGELGSPPLAA